MSFDLFGPATKCDIRVGYISTDRGFVDRVGVHDANQYAKLNPGTIFIFRNREKVQYLNINQVNRLQPSDMLPVKNAGEGGACGGIVGLNGEGDTSKSLDQTLGLPTPDIGGSSQFIELRSGVKLDKDSTRVNFFGGGGVGVQANPIVGKDGSLMAVDVVHGGFGYQYPPLVDISDDRGIGSGANVQAFIKTAGAGNTDYYIEEYDQEEDFEEYDLSRCVPELANMPAGKRYGPDGKELGDFDPSLYIGKSKDPISLQIEKYQELLASLKDGSRLDSNTNRILKWWTTRKEIPLKVVSPDQSTRKVYDVNHWAWGSKPGINDEIDNLYIKLFGRRAEPGGLAYWKKLRDSGQSLAKIEQGMKLQPEWERVQTEGSPTMPDVTYKFGTYWEYDKENFMNSNAISPVPPSNGKGTDMAGKTYTFEWEEDFPWEGEYRFRVQADNDARLYIDNKPLTDVRIGAGGAAGSVLSNPLEINKHLNSGVHKISISLLNHLTKENKKVKRALPVANSNTSSEVTFKVTTDSNYGNSINIDGLFDVGREYKTPQLKETMTKTVEFGKIYNVKINSLQGRARLKTLGESVIGMEDSKDSDYNDLICSSSVGRFYDINGDTCKFIIDPPPKPAPSTTSTGEKGKYVFNTVDWISKANRPLWKINPGAGRDSNFINRFGILPFDPTGVGEVDKDRTKKSLVKSAPPTVKFLRQDSKNYIQVVGTGKVKVFFEMNINDRPGISSLALSEIKIKADDGDIVLKRDVNRRYANEKGSGTFTAGQKYLVKTIGGSRGSGSRIGADKTTIGYDDDYDNGYDENGNLRITGVTPISSVETVNYKTRGLPDYPNASSDDYAGVHEIIWDNLNFPSDGNYVIETMVDDNVNLTFSHPGREDIVLYKMGFRIRGDGSTGTGKSIDTQYFRQGSYRLKAELEQIPGKPLAKGNPMALAVDIKAAFVIDDVEVISAKSWNENPMGVAMTIDAPMPTIPQEIPPAGEGRCPNNPIWSTRHPNGNLKWYPVRVDSWAKFMNRYAISPIAPLGFKGTDGSGIVYRNTWKVNLPYSGYYGLRGSIDNQGRLLIDGEEILGPNTNKRVSPSTSLSPNLAKKYLQGGDHEITVEVENDKQFNYTKIDKKIFSTADWAAKQTQTQKTTGSDDNVEVTFKVSTDSDYGNSITIDGLFNLSREYKTPQIKENVTTQIEAGKVYTVTVKSVQGNEKLKNLGEAVLGMEDYKDTDYNDLICSASSGKFYDINGSTCKFTVPSSKKVETVYGEGLVSGSAKDGVTYSGPSLSTYANGELGAYITPTWNTDEEYLETHNGTTWVMTWNNVDFPETGTYDIRAQADDELIIKLDGVEIAKAEVGKGVESHMFNAPKGRRSIELTLTNLDFNAPFGQNPAVAAVKITKKTDVAKVDPRTGKAQGKAWTVNPIGVSAILIPPPCPKKITGVGIVTSVVVSDPGNGWTPPIEPGDPAPSYPVNLELKEIIPTDGGGINYGKDDVVCIKNTETGEERCFPPNLGPFGQIETVPLPTGDGNLNGYTSWPQIRVRTTGPNMPTGGGAEFIPRFEIVRDPIGLPDENKLLQVTDLVGLKQTGFYDGKPYYGAVFYKEGVRYAGYYETPGKLVQIYDTMQESIDATVTTPPSAILRQGTDVATNNPGLDIPGTPNNLI